MYVNICVYIYIHMYILKYIAHNKICVTNDIFFQNIDPISKSIKETMCVIFAPLSYLPAY